MVKNPYEELYSFRNLELAFRKARKNKRCKKAVQDLEFNLENNLLQIQHELKTFNYKPQPLKQFVIKDPKTRLISASDFKDRVVHHALCNIIQPIFEKTFIQDSYANQIGKGTSKAIERLDVFKRKVSQNGRLINNPKDNNMTISYFLKADIKKFFDMVDHETLIGIIQKKIQDKNILWLIKLILDNHKIKKKGKGMPIGNLTSQFFANVYLNELDYFVKHKLNVKYYVRYVDDFVILHKSKEKLQKYKKNIQSFLKTIKLELHPEKSQIYPMHKGINFLGFRIFYHYKLLRKRNIRRMKLRLKEFPEKYKNEQITLEEIFASFESWRGYAQQADTFNLRRRLFDELKSFI